jgi:hypothetical protein
VAYNLIDAQLREQTHVHIGTLLLQSMRNAAQRVHNAHLRALRTPRTPSTAGGSASSRGSSSSHASASMTSAAASAAELLPGYDPLSISSLFRNRVLSGGSGIGGSSGLGGVGFGGGGIAVDFGSIPSVGGVSNESRLFELVSHFNVGLRIVLTMPNDMRVQVAELNLLAARKAKLAAGYGAALEYCRAGMMLMGFENMAGTSTSSRSVPSSQAGSAAGSSASSSAHSSSSAAVQGVAAGGQALSPAVAEAVAAAAADAAASASASASGADRHRSRSFSKPGSVHSGSTRSSRSGRSGKSSSHASSASAAASLAIAEQAAASAVPLAGGRDVAWTQCYPLSFSLYAERAAVEFLVGNTFQAEGYLKVAMEHAQNTEDKVTLLLRMAAQRTSAGEFSGAISCGIQALQLLRVNLSVPQSAVHSDSSPIESTPPASTSHNLGGGGGGSSGGSAIVHEFAAPGFSVAASSWYKSGATAPSDSHAERDQTKAVDVVESSSSADSSASAPLATVHADPAAVAAHAMTADHLLPSSALVAASIPSVMGSSAALDITSSPLYDATATPASAVSLSSSAPNMAAAASSSPSSSAALASCASTTATADPAPSTALALTAAAEAASAPSAATGASGSVSRGGGISASSVAGAASWLSQLTEQTLRQHYQYFKQRLREYNRAHAQAQQAMETQFQFATTSAAGGVPVLLSSPPSSVAVPPHSATSVLSLLDLPRVTDRTQTLVSQAYASLITPAWLAHQPLLRLVCFKAVLHALEYGLCGTEAFPLLMLGMVLLADFGDVERGAELTTVAFKLADRVDAQMLGTLQLSGSGPTTTSGSSSGLSGSPAGSPVAAASTVLAAVPSSASISSISERSKLCILHAGLLHHWQRPLDQCLPLLDSALNLSLQTGDLAFCGYAFVFKINASFYAGCNLENLYEDTLRAKLSNARILNNGLAADFLTGLEMLLLNFNGYAHYASEFELVTASTQEVQFIARTEQSASALALASFLIFRAHMLYHYGQPWLALQCLQHAQRKIVYLSGWINHAYFLFLHSLCQLALLSRYPPPAGGASSSSASSTAAAVPLADESSRDMSSSSTAPAVAATHTDAKGGTTSPPVHSFNSAGSSFYNAGPFLNLDRPQTLSAPHVLVRRDSATPRLVWCV